MNVMAQFPADRDFDRDLRFRAMFEEAAIGIAICQLDGRILEANLALARMLGYSQQELADTHAGVLFPERRRETSVETSVEIHPDDISLDDISPNKRLLAELMRGERKSFEIEKGCRRKDGSKLWGHLTVSLARDMQRHPAFLVAMLADATERKRLAEHPHEAEKMEVIGRLAGGIAHDFNNLLTGILLYCDLLTTGLESTRLDNEEMENAGLENSELGRNVLESGSLERRALCQHVEEVRMASEQGAALTHQLLAVARRQAAEPRPILIKDVVASSRNFLQRLIGEQIEIVISTDSSVDSRTGLVLADPAQLQQILMNLVLNARDAMPLGGKITLCMRTAEFPSASSLAESRKDAMPGSARRAVSLVVRDNGCGMDAETLAHVFEPFFTTKKPGKGTGLGLASVQRIVREAGGAIEVDSKPGQGTSIEVFFPAIELSIGEEIS